MLFSPYAIIIAGGLALSLGAGGLFYGMHIEGLKCDRDKLNAQIAAQAKTIKLYQIKEQESARAVAEIGAAKAEADTVLNTYYAELEVLRTSSEAANHKADELDREIAELEAKIARERNDASADKANLEQDVELLNAKLSKRTAQPIRVSQGCRLTERDIAVNRSLLKHTPRR